MIRKSVEIVQLWDRTLGKASAIQLTGARSLRARNWHEKSCLEDRAQTTIGALRGPGEPPKTAGYRSGAQTPSREDTGAHRESLLGLEPAQHSRNGGFERPRLGLLELVGDIRDHGPARSSRKNNSQSPRLSCNRRSSSSGVSVPRRCSPPICRALQSMA